MNAKSYGMLLCREDRFLSTKLTAFLLLLALPAGLAAQPPSVPHYILKDLGTLGGPNSGVTEGNALNSSGTVIGESESAELSSLCDCPAPHAFKWNGGRMTDLGTLPDGNDFSSPNAINSSGTIVGFSANGVPDPTLGEEVVATVWGNGAITNLGTFGGPLSVAVAINDLGQVVGSATTTIPDPDNKWNGVGFFPSPNLWHAALWQNGSIFALGTLGGPAADARFIDSRGRVAGQSYIHPQQPIQPPPTPLWENGAPLIHPFFWENGRMTDIGTLGGVFAQASAMNSLGQVVGDSDLRGGAAFHAFRWTQGKMVDLGTIGDASSAALAINDVGTVVGYLFSARVLEGFLWRDGKMIELGALPGFFCNFPHHINNKGQVVGISSLDCMETGQTPWLWQEGVGLVDLNTLVPPGTNMHLVDAQSINDSGVIVGNGMLPNGDFHAFALIPTGSGSSSSAATGTSAARSAMATNATPLELTPAKVAELRVRLSNRAHGSLDRRKGP